MLNNALLVQSLIVLAIFYYSGQDLKNKLIHQLLSLMKH